MQCMHNSLSIHELVRRSKTLTEHIPYSCMLQNDTNCATGNNSRPLACRDQSDARGFKFHINIMKECTAFERNLHHVLPRMARCLFYRHLHLVGFPCSQSHSPLTIPHHHDGAESHAAPPLHHTRDAIHG